MSASRVAVTTVLAFASLGASGSDADVRAQTERRTRNENSQNQTTLPNGTVMNVSVQQNQPAPLNTLKDGVDSAFWDTTQRGPLIAVAPETVRPAWQTRRPGASGTVAPRPEQTPQRQQGGSFRLMDLADFFGRRVVRLKGLSVLAPTDMVVLNTKLGRPDYFANLQQSEKLRMLQGSLTAAQWKLLGSDHGLGAGDLTGDQRDLFLSYLPDPMVINKMRVVGQNSLSGVNDFVPVTLTGGQRSAVRLRIHRTTQFSVPLQGNSNFRFSLDSQPTGTEFAYVNSVNDPTAGETLYGQRIRAIVPSRLKPQQIDFVSPALQSGVSLNGIKTVGELVERVRTVTRTPIFVDGRAAKLTLWIKAGDSQTVRAGEALQALCWSLSGAIRFVADGGGEGKGIFILTEDIEGTGSRMARINEWSEAARQHYLDAQALLLEAIQKQRPLQYIGFGADDPNALDPKISRRVEEGWKYFQGRYRGTSLPLTDLSPQQQEIVRQGMASYDKTRSTYNGEQRDLANDGTVSITVGTRSVFLVPGVGEVRTASYENPTGDIHALLPPPTVMDFNLGTAAPPKPADVASIPRNFPLGGVLWVSPTTDEEARKAVRAARNSGLNQVWVTLPVSPASRQGDEAAMIKAKMLLAAAIAEAKTAKPVVQILAGVRLFSMTTPSEAASADDRDVTITGELPKDAARRRVANYIAADTDPAIPQYQLRNTTDWAAPVAPGLAQRLARKLAEIAGIPGLSGMTLLDTAPPGYGLPIRNLMSISFNSPDAKIEVGYTKALRAAFIRSAGYDPIDLAPVWNFGTVDMRLPFFTDDNRFSMGFDPSNQSTAPLTADGQWNRFRSEVVSRTLSELYGPLMQSLPKKEGGFPVYLQNLDTITLGRVNWFSRWDSKEALPRRIPPAVGQPQNPFQDVPSRAAVSLIDLPYRDYPQSARRPPVVSPGPPVTPAVQFARFLNGMLNGSKGAWKGVVLNFSEVTVDQAIERLQGIVPGK